MLNIFTTILTFVYYSALVISVLSNRFSIEDLVIIFWFEAVCLMIVTLLHVLRVGPQLREGIRIHMVNIYQFLLFCLFQLVFIYGAYNDFSSYIYLDLITFIVKHWLVLLPLTLSTVIASIKVFVHPQKTRRTNSPVVWWLWQIFLPLELSIILLQSSPDSAIIVLLVLVVIKCAVDLWWQRPLRNKPVTPNETNTINYHPFSYFGLLRPFIIYGAALTLFIFSQPSSWDPNVSAMGNALAFIGIEIALVFFMIPNVHSLTWNTETKTLIYTKGRIWKHKISIDLNEVKEITPQYSKRKVLIGYTVRLIKHKPIRISAYFFSHLELHQLILTLKQAYPEIKITPSKYTPATHDNGLL